MHEAVRLDFTLGGILLHTSRLNALRLDAHYTELGTDPAQTAASTQALPAGVDVAVMEAHPVETPLPRLRIKRRALVYAPSQYRRQFVDLDRSFPQYLQTLRSAVRRKFRRHAERFADLNGGKLEWREYRRPEDLEEFYGLAREVSRKTYQERELNCGLPEEEQFRKELAAQASGDEVRCYLLFHQARPAAYALCRAARGILTYEKAGYDPALRQIYPGMVLLHLILRRLFEERRFSRFDFGPGEYRYKRSLATGSLPCADVYCYRLRPRLVWLLCLHSATDMISRTAGRLLERLHWKERAQRWIRLNLGDPALAWRHAWGGKAQSQHG